MEQPEEVTVTEAELRVILNSMMELVMVIDSEGRYLKVVSNPHLLALDPKLLLGKNLFEVFPPQQAEKFMSSIQTVIKEQNPIAIEYSLLIDGRETWFATNISPLPNNQVAIVARDVTERRAVAIALKEKNQLLTQTIDQLKTTQADLVQSEKMAVLGQLIAGIAHEVNTPLGAIQASISNINYALQQSLAALPQILQELSPAEVTEFMSLLEIARDRCSNLSSREERQLKRQVKQILIAYELNDAHLLAEYIVRIGLSNDISRWLLLLRHPHSRHIFQIALYISSMQTNSFNIELAVTQAARIVTALKNYTRQDTSLELANASVIEGIETVLTIYHNKIKRGIEVIKNYSQVPHISCYPEKLIQVWSNLIGNAIQAMNCQGKLEIAVYLEPIDGEVPPMDRYLVVAISDSGSGIPLELQEKVFQPFFTTKPYGEGTGLGLDIVKKIVSEHGGKISLDSKPGSTTFKVLLPILVKYT